MRIFIDIDGVLADFCRAFSDAGGFDHEAILRDWPKGEYDMCKAYRLKKNRHDGIFCSVWWSSIPKTAECDAILAAVEPFRVDVMFVTRILCGLIGEELYRRIRATWVAANLGDYPIVFDVSAEDRATHAAPDDILFDDCDANGRAWACARGRFICVTRPWNSGTLGVLERLEHFKTQFPPLNSEVRYQSDRADCRQ